MNKKNIYLILIGILLLALRFTIHINYMVIDILSDPVAFVLIIIGSKGLVPRNKLFKKAFISSILGLIATCVGQAICLMDWGESSSQINSISVALSIIFTIYYTYYFTEGLILESKFQDKSALTKSLRSIWFILGSLIFVHYIVFGSRTDILALSVEAVVGISAIFYISSVSNISKQLYMDEIPQNHRL